MKKTIFLVFLLSLVLFTSVSGKVQSGVGGSSFPKNDITYSTEVVTPHVSWATNLPGGPIKSFFIPSVQYGRDMVELMQRLQLQPTTDSIDSSWDINCWGIGDFYGHEFRGDRDDFQIVYGYVEKDLTGKTPFEVMVIPGLNGWSRMTRASRDAILRRVQEGAGLVLLHPFVGDVKQHPFKGDETQGDQRIWDISPLIGVADDTVNERGYPEVNRDAVAKGQWQVNQSHFITDGIPLQLLPEGNTGGSFYKYRANGDVLVRSGEFPIIATKTYGRGRVVALGYTEEGFTPQSIDPYETRIYWDYWEYQYSLLARSILWASGRPLPIQVKSLKADPAAIKLSVSSDAKRAIEIEVSGKNEFGQSLGSTRFERTIDATVNTIEIPTASLKPKPVLSGGRQIFDLIIRDPQSKATLNWGSTTFSAPKQAMMTSVKPAVDVYRRGETLSAVLRATGDLSGLQMRMRVSDDLGRVLGTISAPARGERTFTHLLENYLGKSAFVTAELVDGNGAIVDQVRAKPVMVVQSTRREKEYTALVSFGGTKHYLQDAQMRMVRAAAADTGFTWSGDVDNSLNIPRGTFGVYWYDRGPTTPEAIEQAIAEYKRTGDFEALGYLTKKELFKRTGDKTFLRRTPSFNDAEFIKRLSDIVRATARNKARYNMDYYFVGDEGSLTSYGDPVDFDWSPQTLDSFRAWLKVEYATLERLNAEWRTSFKEWNAVVPYTTDEARRSRSFAPWADHRTFMEITFAKAYEAARIAALEGDRDAHIAVSGTQATNAYNGADWSRLDRVIDDFLSYDGGNQWDMHRSFAKPEAMIGFWTGYGSHGLAVQNAIWTAAIHNVLHPNIFWMYSFLNPDMTHSASARDMGRAFSSLRSEGVGKLLMESERESDGIALYYSMPSIHAASIMGYHQRSSDDDEETPDKSRISFPANRDGWVRTIKDLGLQFDFTPANEVAQTPLSNEKYKVLILPMTLALSKAELQNIENFVSNGGVVIADAAPGLVNEHCTWQQGEELNKLFGIASVASDKRELKNTPAQLSVTEEGSRWSISAKDLTDLSVAEPDLKASTGTPLLRTPNGDAAIVRQVGKGWAIYLNLLLDHYSRQRAINFGGGGYRSLVKAVFSKIGKRPAVDVLTADGQPVSQAQIVRYKFANSELLAIVKENVSLSGVVGKDGVTIYNDASLGQVARQDLTIKLPQKYYVADVRSGKQLGFTDTVHSSALIGDALILGLSATQNKLRVEGPAVVQIGHAATVNIGSDAVGRSLVRAHVFGPDGSFIPIYSRNVLLPNGHATFVVPFAFNDQTGKYKVRITDVVTGADSEITIEVK